MLALLVTAGAVSCASEEIPKYGDPARVAGGPGGGDVGGGGTGGAACSVNDQCPVSFQDDVFPVLNGKAGGCAGATTGCHADGKGGLTLVAGDVASFYDALMAYQLDNPPAVGKYIVPCDPDKSKMPCNLKVANGTNPHTACGSGMPPVPANGPTLEELAAIEDWIACGAPNN